MGTDRLPPYWGVTKNNKPTSSSGFNYQPLTYSHSVSQESPINYFKNAQIASQGKMKDLLPRVFVNGNGLNNPCDDYFSITAPKTATDDLFIVANADLGNCTTLTISGLTGNNVATVGLLLTQCTQLTSLRIIDANGAQIVGLLGELSDELKGKLVKLDISQTSEKETPIWSHHDITEFSTSFGKFTNLTHLNLAGNCLGEHAGAAGALNALANSLANLTKLTHLNLAKNALGWHEQTAGALQSLAKSLGKLTNLTYLNLAKNALGRHEQTAGALNTLADSLKMLTNLTYLNLASNNLWSCNALELKALAESLGKLTNLTYLNLASTNLWHCNAQELKAFTTSLGELTNLTHLDLAGNDLWRHEQAAGALQAFAKSLGKLTNLTYLNLASTNLWHCNAQELKAFAKSLGKLTNLTYLNLAKHDLWRHFLAADALQAFAKSLGELTNLTYLNLAGDDVCQHTSMQVDALVTLVESIGKLTNLTHLNLAGNDLGWYKEQAATAFTKLAKSLGKLTNLTHLDLANNNVGCHEQAVGALKTLARSLGKLTNLTHLDLANNWWGRKQQATGTLKLLAESLGKLTNLTYLNLSNNWWGFNLQKEQELLGFTIRLVCIVIFNELCSHLGKQHELSRVFTIILACLAALASLKLAINELKCRPQAAALVTNLHALTALTYLRLGSNFLEFFLDNKQLKELEELEELANSKRTHPQSDIFALADPVAEQIHYDNFVAIRKKIADHGLSEQLRTVLDSKEYVDSLATSIKHKNKRLRAKGKPDLNRVFLRMLANSHLWDMNTATLFYQHFDEIILTLLMFGMSNNSITKIMEEAIYSGDIHLTNDILRIKKTPQDTTSKPTENDEQMRQYLAESPRDVQRLVIVSYASQPQRLV